ncbi:MAG: HAMP domain-containing protein, partial [Gammaproteobacteria bacterium]|nr:HAMP domain-containing protein [Gammaproteobacteria bacterium]
EKLDLSVGPFLDALVANTSLQQLEAESAAASATQFGAQLLYMTVLAVLLGLALAGLLGFLIYRSIVKPLSLIDATVRDVAQGDLLARTGVTGTDELGALGSAFDSMLSERVATLAQAKEENDKLNDSVIGLLEAVSQLSRRDLTVSVPVTEDVTGPVADSLNLLTGETAKVLQGVRDVSALVAAASAQVKSQSDRLINRASAERAQVIQTSETLTAASERMTRIARLAQASTVAGDEAIDSTRTAMERVTGTVSGITDIRDTIRETEKRIKRLGERSQEISGVVDLINSIAERTHILALNASMHAASAGEAGRGFAVVADEVQRLAENAREATSQISTLVGNIQVETSDTVNIMNHVITQVVDGTKLAEQAGKQMEDTRERTASLVAMVQRIAKGSLRQAKTSLELRERAHLFAQSTIDTSAELDEQSTQTDALVAHAARLVESVNVFVLPSVNKPESASVDPERTVVLEHHTDAIVNG